MVFLSYIIDSVYLFQIPLPILRFGLLQSEERRRSSFRPLLLVSSSFFFLLRLGDRIGFFPPSPYYFVGWTSLGLLRDEICHGFEVRKPEKRGQLFGVGHGVETEVLVAQNERAARIFVPFVKRSYQLSGVAEVCPLYAY